MLRSESNLFDGGIAGRQQDTERVVLRERSEKYRRFAEECLQMAAVSEDEPTRAIFKFMAQVWLRLAQEYEWCGAVPMKEVSTSKR